MEGIERLERDGKVEVKPGALRWLRGLWTPEARGAAAAALKKADNQDDARRKVLAIEKDQWIRWQWREGNSFIPHGMGVCLCGLVSECSATPLSPVVRATRRSSPSPPPSDGAHTWQGSDTRDVGGTGWGSVDVSLPRSCAVGTSRSLFPVGVTLPPLPPCPAAEQEEERLRFARAVTLEDLKVDLRSWQPTAARPVPPFEVLEQAPVWTSSKFGGLREGILRRSAAPVEVATTAADLKVLDFPRRQTQGATPPAGPLARVLLYKETCPAIPLDALASPVRLVVVATTGRAAGDAPLRLHSHVLRSAGTAAVAVYGDVSSARALAQELEAGERRHVRRDIDVWVRDRAPPTVGGPRHRLVRRLLVLMAGPNLLDEAMV